MTGAQEQAFAESDAGNTGFEQMAGIQKTEIAIKAFILCHLRQNTHSQSQSDVGLDHIRISGGKRYARCKSASLEGIVDVGTIGETEHISENGIFRHGLQR